MAITPVLVPEEGVVLSQEALLKVSHSRVPPPLFSMRIAWLPVTVPEVVAPKSRWASWSAPSVASRNAVRARCAAGIVARSATAAFRSVLPVVSPCGTIGYDRC